MPPPATVGSLARRLGLEEEVLQLVATNAEDSYRQGQVQKADGSYRPIAEPFDDLKALQRRILDRVLRDDLRIVSQIDYSQPGRDSVLAAKLHEGAAWIGTIDIRDFFGSVSSGRVYTTLLRAGCSPDVARLLTRIVTRAGCLPQGAPTSPAVASLILADLDRELEQLAFERELTATRYVDDIVVSGASHTKVAELVEHIARRLRSLSLRPARRKTGVVQGCRARVHGLRTSPSLAVTRAFRRKLRSVRRRRERLGEAPDGTLEGMTAYAEYVRRVASGSTGRLDRRP